MKINFTIPGEAVAKGRPRLGKFGTYTPERTVNYENWVKTCYMQKYNIEQKLEGRLKARIIIFCSIPKSTSQKKKLGMLIGNISPVKRPDWDNLGKSICDALNKIAYNDDAQIVDCHVVKLYSEEPRAEVEIEEF